MWRVVVAVILGAAVPGGGCDRAPAPQPPPASQEPAPPPPPFTWEVRGDVGNFTKGSGGGGSSRVGNNALEIRDGRAFANGKDGGPLNPGDAVLLDRDGRLFVNCRERVAK